jgi:hypothetical protein
MKYLLLIPLFIIGCGGDYTVETDVDSCSSSVCGDSVYEPDCEECDRNMDYSCLALMGYGYTGRAMCNDTCDGYDTTTCRRVN